MKKTRVNKAGREVITAEYAHALATAPFRRSFQQAPSYLWAGTLIAHPLVGVRTTNRRHAEEDADIYAEVYEADGSDDLLAFVN